MKTVDMSPEAITQRMKRLDELWELTVALRSSDLEHARPVESEDKRASPGNATVDPKAKHSATRE
ncbi:MAG TPA: hypothetical protein VGI80_07640 [Pyrinomonadaceae bacterium]|jgi:hypothetical protein